MAQQMRLSKYKTKIVKDDEGYTNVILYNTIIVKFDDDVIILNSGQWHTNTTKTRMNQCANQYGLDFKVYQDDFQWYVWIDNMSESIEFFDGMRIARV
jgi:hypothetical protein